MMFKRTTLHAIAEAQSETLGRLSRVLQDAEWKLDAALSADRKDRAGYRRNNAANPDGGPSFDASELAEAVDDARQLLLALEPLQNLVSLRRRQITNVERPYDAEAHSAYYAGVGGGFQLPGFVRALFGSRS